MKEHDIHTNQIASVKKNYGKNKNMCTFQNKNLKYIFLFRQFSLSPPIFGNSIATNFFPLIYGNFIAKITIKFPPLQFQQLGCHNFFFPPIFSNLVATIPFFLFPHSPTILATQLPRLVFSLSSTSPLGTSFGQQILCSNNFGNLITQIQNFFLTPTITSFISHLSYFLLEFRQRCYRNLLLSSFSQITSNCTHITNKLNFLQYSAKRL